MTAKGKRVEGGGTEQKGERIMDMDNSVVTKGARRYKEEKCNKEEKEEVQGPARRPPESGMNAPRG